jgi:hypothetical protein
MNAGLGACEVVRTGPRGPSIPIIISFPQACSIPTQVAVLALVLRDTFTLAYLVEASEYPAYLVVNNISTSLMQFMLTPTDHLRLGHEVKELAQHLHLLVVH